MEKIKQGLDPRESSTNRELKYNQVDQLEKEVQYWKSQVEELKQECLSLYRRLYGEDRPRM